MGQQNNDSLAGGYRQAEAERWATTPGSAQTQPRFSLAIDTSDHQVVDEDTAAILEWALGPTMMGVARQLLGCPSPVLTACQMFRQPHNEPPSPRAPGAGWPDGGPGTDPRNWCASNRPHLAGQPVVSHTREPGSFTVVW